MENSDFISKTNDSWYTKSVTKLQLGKTSEIRAEIQDRFNDLLTTYNETGDVSLESNELVAMIERNITSTNDWRALVGFLDYMEPYQPFIQQLRVDLMTILQTLLTNNPGMPNPSPQPSPAPGQPGFTPMPFTPPSNLFP
jgi:hypothetical protein